MLLCCRLGISHTFSFIYSKFACKIKSLTLNFPIKALNNNYKQMFILQDKNGILLYSTFVFHLILKNYLARMNQSLSLIVRQTISQNICKRKGKFNFLHIFLVKEFRFKN